MVSPPSSAEPASTTDVTLSEPDRVQCGDSLGRWSPHQSDSRAIISVMPTMVCGSIRETRCRRPNRPIHVDFDLTLLYQPWLLVVDNLAQPPLVYDTVPHLSVRTCLIRLATLITDNKPLFISLLPLSTETTVRPQSSLQSRPANSPGGLILPRHIAFSDISRLQDDTSATQKLITIPATACAAELCLDSSTKSGDIGNT